MALKSAQIMPLAALGIATGFVALFYFEALKRISGFLATVIVSLEVPIVISLERNFLGVSPSMSVIAGGVAVIVGALIISSESRKLTTNQNEKRPPS